jgi:transcriptional regulator with XRE-family HTH domain
MNTLGDNIMLLRKKKSLSQAALGKIIGTSGDVIGRYERGDISPSIDVVSKVAEALEVSIDYLVGKTSLKMDSNIIQRIEEIETLNQDAKSFVLRVLDMALRESKEKRYV